MKPSERIKQIQRKMDEELNHNEPVCMVSFEDAMLKYLDEEYEKKL